MLNSRNNADVPVSSHGTNNQPDSGNTKLRKDDSNHNDVLVISPKTPKPLKPLKPLNPKPLKPLNPQNPKPLKP